MAVQEEVVHGVVGLEHRRPMLPGDRAGCLIQSLSPVEARGMIRMLVEKFDLFFQLVRCGPVIIAFEPGDVLSATGLDDRLVVVVDAEVLLVK